MKKNILREKTRRLKSSGKKGLSFFLTGCWPSTERFTELLKIIDGEDLADFVEVGVPFSDPLADGPVIRRASGEAISSGVTLEKITEAAADIRNQIKMPLVLMSYLNVLLAGGIEKNLEAVSGAGFSALIIPDLPAEESGSVSGAARRFGIDTVLLASPSTSQERLKMITRRSRPFLYYVSSFGVTGTRPELPEDLREKLSLALRVSPCPVYCGFGISSPAQAREVAAFSDGVIIGSALTKKIISSSSGCFNPVKKFAISIRRQLRKMEDNARN